MAGPEIVRAIELLRDRDLIRLARLVSREIRDRLMIRRIIRRLGRRGDVSRLSEKLAQAAAIAPKQAKKIEDRADAIIAREADIEKRTEEAFTPHEAMLDEAEKGLTDLASQLATMSNNPPLSPSDEPVKPCLRCVSGSMPRRLGTGEWVHDISVDGNSSISQVPCTNPPK